MPTVRRAAAAAAVVLALTGCSGSQDAGPPTPTTSPSDPGTPLRAFDTSTLIVARAPFCDRVVETDIEAAIGRAPSDSVTRASGDPVPVDGSTDVGAESGCRYTAGRSTAEAWVFTPPVTVARARALVHAAARADGCRVRRDAPDYGSPSVTTLCGGSGKQPAAVQIAGLFGDAWLTCRLSVARTSPAALLDRTGRWCVAVATAAAPDA